MRMYLIFEGYKLRFKSAWFLLSQGWAGGTELSCNSVHAIPGRNLNGTAVPSVAGTGYVN